MHKEETPFKLLEGNQQSEKKIKQIFEVYPKNDELQIFASPLFYYVEVRSVYVMQECSTEARLIGISFYPIGLKIIIVYVFFRILLLRIVSQCKILRKWKLYVITTGSLVEQ